MPPPSPLQHQPQHDDVSLSFWLSTIAMTPSQPPRKMSRSVQYIYEYIYVYMC